MRMIKCRRLNAKLSPESCAANWRKAQDFDEKSYLNASEKKYWGVSGMRGNYHPHLKKCQDCPQGRRQALNIKGCGVEGCTRPHRRNGMCDTHSKQAWPKTPRVKYNAKLYRQKTRVCFYTSKEIAAQLEDMAEENGVSRHSMAYRVLKDALEARNG